MKIDIEERILYEAMIDAIKNDIIDIYRNPNLLRIIRSAVYEYLSRIPIRELIEVCKEIKEAELKKRK